MVLKVSKIPIIGIFLILMYACNNPFAGVEQHEKYQIPDQLAGKLFTQVSAESDLTIFASALEITGYDTIFNTSGSYTVLAPTDSAFDVFFLEHPDYHSLDDIPPAELLRMVRFLTLQNSWNEDQFRNLSANNGWGTDNTEEWKTSFVFKKETILEEAPRKVWMDEERRITDSVIAEGRYIERESDYRKFMPVFTREYFSFNDLSAADYQLYFDRDLEVNDDIYAADAKFLNKGIFAANGFLYKIDRVVLPLDNAEAYLEKSPDYSRFLKYLREFSDASELFPYHIGNFQIGLEKIYSTNERIPMYNHAGIVVPTNRAFIEFIQDYLAAQGGMEDLLLTFKQEILNSFFLREIRPIYTKELEEGYYNYNKEKIVLDPSKIIEKKFTSNATIIGYDDFLVPNIFTSVGAPLVLSGYYNLFLEAVLISKTNNALKDQGQYYSFYIIPDLTLEEDSSLYISERNDRLTTWDFAEGKEIQQSNSILKTRLLNQVALGVPSGIATKEYLKNMAGNYIIAEKQGDGTLILSGKEQSIFGYKQADTSLYIDIVAKELLGYNISNGKAFEVEGWFNYAYSSGDEIVNKLKYNYSEFFDALRQSGSLSQNEKEILFYNPDLQHTVFAPTDEAMAVSGFDAMSIAEKKEFVQAHFIVGDIIFTDGNKNSGKYRTIYGTELNIGTGIDVINILKPGGDLYYSIDVNSENTNEMLLTVKPEHDDDQAFTSYATTAVLHQIDTVLFNSILTQ